MHPIEGAGAPTESPTENQGRRLAKVGNKEVLVIREQRSSFSAAHIASEIFGINGDMVNLASQYAACSYGKLTFSRWTGNDSVVNGVLTVSIANSITNTDDNTIRDAMVNQAVKDLGGSALNTHADHVMVCVPKGTSGGWIAYAYINHWLSGKFGIIFYLLPYPVPSSHSLFPQHIQFTTTNGATSPRLSFTSWAITSIWHTPEMEDLETKTANTAINQA